MLFSLVPTVDITCGHRRSNNASFTALTPSLAKSTRISIWQHSPYRAIKSRGTTPSSMRHAAERRNARDHEATSADRPRRHWSWPALSETAARSSFDRFMIYSKPYQCLRAHLSSSPNMDGLSAAAGVLGVIQAAARVTTALVQYVASVQGAEASRKKLIDHIECCQDGQKRRT
ncbi:hypothetical protein BDN67DRAFT_695764 [Paxillus ammoniavirescens]|nr:hypothetical protein BDN67DRAFT_695764 [Paxillus ammoniavirescens]